MSFKGNAVPGATSGSSRQQLPYNAVMDGHAWGSGSRGQVWKHTTQLQPWPHEAENVNIPMPSARVLEVMEKEVQSRRPTDPPGPIGAKWLDVVAIWQQRLRRRFLGNSLLVTGAWKVCSPQWKTRAARMPPEEAARVMKFVTTGTKAPFQVPPPGPVRTLRNHRDLHQQKNLVWKTLQEQLQEAAIRPWRVEKGLPKGMYALRWVAKGDTGAIRLTVNMRPLNAHFRPEASAVELDTWPVIRHLFWRRGYCLGLDQHSSFYHAPYHPDDQTWYGFSVAESELPEGAAETLRQAHPQCELDGRFVFVYQGLAMGAAPSVAQLSAQMDALFRVWRRCKIGAGDYWIGSNYIDDCAFQTGRFASAVELSLRILAEFTVLGFTVHVRKKSQILPTLHFTHLGLRLCTRTMTFSLPAARIRKLRSALDTLQAQVKVRQKVPAVMIAKVIGSLWAIEPVAHRAVGIMCRGMIDVLAEMLGTNELRRASKKFLPKLLKRAWRGLANWSAEAQADLDFWGRVQFGQLKGDAHWDRHAHELETAVFYKGLRIPDGIRVFAADTSDTGSGGGEFIRDGALWMKKGDSMCVPLSASQRLESSTLRELLGILALHAAVIPDNCRRVVVVCDNQASIQILKRGSKLPDLQAIARQIFLQDCKLHRVTWPVWRRRDHAIIQQCDDASRFVDNHDTATPAAAVRAARDLAKKHFASDFTFDRFASSDHCIRSADDVQLPFNSRWLVPGTSGVDAFQQVWAPHVNFVNAPFALIGRVVALMRAQQAKGVVLIPVRPRARWAAAVQQGAEGVRAKQVFKPATQGWKTGFKGFYAWVVIDFERHIPLQYRSQRGQVFLRTLTGKTITLEYHPERPLADLQRHIEQRCGVPPEKQRLLLGGKEVAGLTLGAAGLRQHDTLTLLLRLRGGSRRAKQTMYQLLKNKRQRLGTEVAVRQDGEDVVAASSLRRQMPARGCRNSETLPRATEMSKRLRPRKKSTNRPTKRMYHGVQPGDKFVDSDEESTTLEVAAVTYSRIWVHGGDEVGYHPKYVERKLREYSWHLQPGSGVTASGECSQVDAGTHVQQRLDRLQHGSKISVKARAAQREARSPTKKASLRAAYATIGGKGRLRGAIAEKCRSTLHDEMLPITSKYIS